MRLLVIIPLLLAAACLRENGAFDGDSNSAGSGSSTAITSLSTTGPGPTSSTTADTGTETGTTAQTAGSTTEAITGGATTADTTSDTTSGTTSDTTGTTGTTGETSGEPTLCGTLPAAWKIGAVEKLATPVNLPKPDLDMWLSEPGMLLMWSSHRDGKVDTYRATRLNPGGDFGPADNNQDIGLSTPGEDTKITLSRDEERAYLATKLPADPGHRLYVGDRKNGNYAPLSPVALDFPGYPDIVDPHVSNDDMRLYYAATNAVEQRLVVATRPAPDQPFGQSSAAPFVNIDEPDRNEFDPTLPAHELVVIYALQGDLAESGNDLYFAVRASVSDPFGAPEKFPGVNSDMHDMSPHISSDGCELFFTRGTVRDPYDWDIYRVEIQ